MRVKFLLGPAGSGKTWQCLHEVRQELKSSPAGLPLIFVAPKQATYQLEYELLADPDLPGYTRLKIVSFDALAELILDAFAGSPSRLLSEQGRVMVLRALLARQTAGLKVFQTTARLPGFAQHLSQLLRELQHHQQTPGRLLEGAASQAGPASLADKLHDLALLQEAYLAWLEQNRLEDSDRLLGLAAREVKAAARASQFRLGGLWLDGFAEMTPQEMELLISLLPACEQATLAFCLESALRGEEDWFSMWTVTSQTFCRCRQQIELLPDIQTTLQVLARDPRKTRFAGSAVLAHLERHWSVPAPFPVTDAADLEAGFQIWRCANPEAEAVTAAREILQHVQKGGGRFRDVAVLVRSLDDYQHVVRRVFSRYEIPFFLDQRESIAHHPLAELTRYAVRTVLSGWEHTDWFGLLKTGLVPGDATLIDRLENEALAHGWQGANFWRNPLRLEEEPEVERRLEALRSEIVPPFVRFALSLQAAGQPTGTQLAQALRLLWDDLQVAETLETWGQVATDEPTGAPQADIHGAARREMEDWLDDLQLAFANTAFALVDWLAVIDAGLTGLSVGVVPPALDQVLVGAVDRSRHPDLQVVMVLGLNERVFPAVPPPPALLNEAERALLASAGLTLGLDRFQQVGRERFLGYIACTRARRRVVLTYAERDRQDKALNPSPLLDQVRQLFPNLKPRTPPATLAWPEVIHPAEALPMLLQARAENLRTGAAWQTLASLPCFAPALVRFDQMTQAQTTLGLSAAVAEQLYGPTLFTSISDLEDYAACPFKFFVRRGLKSEEREEFETDVRERGSFLHEILMAFHQQLQQEGKRWRDITPAEASARVARLGETLQKTFRQGLFDCTPERQFAARMLIENLRDCIAVLAEWAQQYLFDPTAVELSFGTEAGDLAVWSIDLGGGHSLSLRGRIDRVDLHPRPDGSAEVVVIDYKSGGQKLDEIRLQNGLDLQLLAYLGVLQHNPNILRVFEHARLLPAGAFYVGLRPAGGSASHRQKAFAEAEATRKKSYQHLGRFDAALLDLFDNRGQAKGDQFKYSITKKGELNKSGNEALPSAAFGQLVLQTEEFLRTYGREIYGGKISVAPFRIGKKTACDYCHYRTVCRFDAWVEPYRVLKKKT